MGSSIQKGNMQVFSNEVHCAMEKHASLFSGGPGCKGKACMCHKLWSRMKCESMLVSGNKVYYAMGKLILCRF